MAKDPAFLFYPGDFNTGTQFFTDEQVGKYMRLLMAQHQHGHLNDNHIIHICKTYDKDVMAKFKKDKDGLWYNERLENEVIKRKEYSNSRSKNRSNKKDISKTYVKHMENRNENEDILDTVFNSSIAKILNKKYEAGPERGMEAIGQDVDALILQMKKQGLSNDQILNQAKSMKAYYDLKEWPMPTNYIKLVMALTENDWPQKLKDEDPERKAERINRSIKDANRREPEPDTIGVSAPGSLD